MQQSFLNQKTTQTTMFKLVVLSCTLALAVAKPSGLAPYGFGWPGALAAPWGASLAGPVIAPLAAAHIAAPLAVHAPAVAAAPALAAYNYRGPLSLAPGQPANILANDGRPLDTLSVNLDRAAHYTARALDPAGAHIIGKRSAPLLGAAWSHAARVDYPTARLVAPVAHIGLAAAVPAAPLGVHGVAVGPWGAGPLGWPAARPLGHLW